MWLRQKFQRTEKPVRKYRKILFSYRSTVNIFHDLESKSNDFHSVVYFSAFLVKFRVFFSRFLYLTSLSIMRSILIYRDISQTQGTYIKIYLRVLYTCNRVLNWSTSKWEPPGPKAIRGRIRHPDERSQPSAFWWTSSPPPLPAGLFYPPQPLPEAILM